MSGARLAGIADTPVGRLHGTSTMALTAAAVRDAVADRGGSRDDLDGLITVSPMVGGHPRQALAVAEQLGITPSMRWLSTPQLGEASALAGVVEAVRLVDEGICSAVVVVAADTPRTGTERSSSVAAFGRMRHPDCEQPYGLSNVGAYALLASTYLHRYGLPDDPGRGADGPQGDGRGQPQRRVP